MGDELRPYVADIPLLALDQKPGKRSGPSGRLTSLLDAVIKRYDAQGKVTVEQREAFHRLPETLRDASTGEVATTFWQQPRLLHALGQQLVSICAARPRVYTGSTWTDYSAKRVLTNRLDESVFHTSNRTIQAPDSANMGGITCSAWTETRYAANGLPLTSTMVGFRASDGAWITEPRELYVSQDTDIVTMAKVVTDESFFWVFYNWFSSGNYVHAGVYDTHGVQLAELNIIQHAERTPGYWDVHGSANTGVMFVQPANPPADSGVETTLFSFDGVSIITPTTVTDSSVHCIGPVAFLTNDVSSTREYIGTLGTAEEGGSLWAYELSPVTGLQTHEYAPGVSVIGLDTLTGWTFASTGGVAVRLSAGLLAPAQATGPKYDPGCRSVVCCSTLRNGTTTGIDRTNTGLAQVSRAFKVEDQYNAVTYWQSGSGLVQQAVEQAITWTAGDYMLGAQHQPITLATGDYAEGSPFNVVSAGFPTVVVLPSAGSLASTAIAAGDTVEIVTASGLGPTCMVPDGTLLLKWTIASHTFTSIDGGILSIAGTNGVALANGDYLIAGTTGLTSHQVYTWGHSQGNGNVSFPAGTFPVQTGSPTAQVAKGIYYGYAATDARLTTSTRPFYLGGDLTVSGTGTPDDGSHSVFQLFLPGELFGTFGPLVVTRANGGESVYTGTWTGVLSPLYPNLWVISDGSPFDSTLVGSKLTVAGSPNPSNNDSVAITAASGSSITTGGATATFPEKFVTPFPTASIDLEIDQTPYTFYIQGVTMDYTWNNALIEVQDANHAGNDQVYQVLSVKDSHHLYAKPVNGSSTARSETFPNTVSITVFFSASQQPEFQSTWFITPLEGTQPQVGCFERGLAYADWRFEGQEIDGDPVTNTYPLSVSSVYSTLDSVAILMLPYRAKSFTAGQFAQTPGTSTTNVTTTVGESTVGLKLFSLSADCGLPGESGDSLLLPGPMASEFTASGFHEQGINLGPEAPFLVSQEQDSAVVGLTPGSTYFYQAVFECTDENGDRVFSYPSPILEVQLGGDKNTATIAGRDIMPLGSDGTVTSNFYGLSNRRLVGISLYRTTIINGTPSTLLYKITNDLNVNGLYSGSGSGSGFTFPDVFTWQFRDQIADALVTSAEVVYAGTVGQGYLPRYPAPPHRQSCIAGSRRFVCGYDGAVWMSGEKTEGDAWWYFPGFRFTFPSPAVACAVLDNILVVTCEAGISYLPLSQFPNNAGTAGSLPSPVQLPFPNGCTGFAVTTGDGVVYSSTAGSGQLWLLGRDLQNRYFSEPVEDFSTAINALFVDEQQRLCALSGGTGMIAYDPVPKRWYSWRMPTTPAIACTWRGKPAYQDAGDVLQQQTGYVDISSNGGTGIAMDFTLADLDFGKVRSVKTLWQVQVMGKALGDCAINCDISYPDQPGTATTTNGPRTLSASDGSNVLLVAYPGTEEASLYSIRVYTTFPNGPGQAFSVELLSAEVGVDSATGLNQLPDSFRAV
jgi:hypothetical protein